MKKLTKEVLLLITLSGFLVANTQAAEKRAQSSVSISEVTLSKELDKSSTKRHIGAIKTRYVDKSSTKFLQSTTNNTSNRCKTNAGKCNRTTANLLCGGQSEDPDGDGSHTCKKAKKD